MYLARIAISENHRKQGFGQFCMKKFEERAIAEKYKMTSLHVHISNSTAINFYKSLGYHGSDKPNMKVIKMEKTLQS